MMLISDDEKQQMENTIRQLTQDKLLQKKKVDSLAREIKILQREIKTREHVDQNKNLPPALTSLKTSSSNNNVEKESNKNPVVDEMVQKNENKSILIEENSDSSN